MAIIVCSLCGRELATNVPGAFEKVTGWVSGQGSKGFRTDTHLGVWAHESCLNKDKAGLNVNQLAFA
jgi:hypothetical protein